MQVGIIDKVLAPHVKGIDIMPCADEAEAVAIAAGYYFATGKTGEVYISADGFMNTLNFLTSWIIPEKIPMRLIISIGRMEPPHRVATEITEPIINLLKQYGAEGLTYEFVR